MDDQSFQLMGRAGVETVLERMAAAIQARVAGEVALVGIRRRGAPLAERLAERIGQRTGAEVAVGEFELKRYADDLTVLHERPWMADPKLSFDVADRTVILIDDVLYTGRTILRAATWLDEAGAARAYCAVLCTRGAVDLPIEAAFVGLHLEVGEGNIIEVHVPPYEEDLAIYVRRRPEG